MTSCTNSTSFRPWVIDETESAGKYGLRKGRSIVIRGKEELTAEKVDKIMGRLAQFLNRQYNLNDLQIAHRDFLKFCEQEQVTVTFSSTEPNKKSSRESLRV